MAEPKRKPLSFNTTMRNPNRIAGFLSVLCDYEGEILDDDLIFEICLKIIIKKLYKPNAVNKNSDWSDIYNSTEKSFTLDEAKEIMKSSPQKHKEAGFKEGWASRFDTWYKLIMEFGMCFYAMGEKIEISPLGKTLVSAYEKEPVDDVLIQNVFLNAMTKFQTSTPFRKNANKNIPLVLLLNVIKLLKEDSEENDAGVFRKEIAFFLCWPNNDAEELYRYIKNFRKQYHFNVSDEIVYEHCLKLFVTGDESDTDALRNYIKMSKLMVESTDEYIRKMRITGVISLRGNGRFLDFNSLEMQKISYIIASYGQYVDFDTKKDYYHYVQQKDMNLFSASDKEKDNDIIVLKQIALKKYAKLYTDEKLEEELNLTYKGSSKDSLLKFIDAPARLEFLSAIALVKYFSDIRVIPNYSADDEGLPKFTARGGAADIECYQKDCYTLVEVTLMTGAAQQTEHEMTSISDHLKKAAESSLQYTIALFIAPILRERAIDYMEYMNERKLINNKCGGTIPMLIKDMISKFKEVDTLKQLVSLRQ